MKAFFIQNWFKLITSISFFIFSFGFLIHSLTPLKAGQVPIQKKINTLNIGEEFVTGVGVDENYAYIIDFEVDGRNTYYKIPLSKFRYSSDSGRE